MGQVLVLAPYVPHPPAHGGSIRSRVLLDALLADHRVHLAAAVANDAERERAAALARATGADVHALPATDRGASALRKLGHWAFGRSELLYRRWTTAARQRVDELAATHAFDLVVLDGTFVLPVWQRQAPRLLLHLHNLEHALLARGDGVHRGLADRWSRRVEARRIRTCEASALAFAHRTVVVSELDRELAARLCPPAAERIAVIENSVDVERLPLLPALPSPPVGAGPRLLFVGGLDYPPNLEAATELVEQHLPVLRAAFPGLVVRLVGRDPQRASERWRGRDGIELAGAVDDLRPYYGASHAVYVPMRSGGGTRIKILEAWALGVPVLASAVASEGLAAVDGEHLCRVETPQQGIAALRAVLDGLAATLRAHGRALVEQRYAHGAASARWRALIAAMLAR